jgi:hypothetical protein
MGQRAQQQRLQREESTIGRCRPLVQRREQRQRRCRPPLGQRHPRGRQVHFTIGQHAVRLNCARLHDSGSAIGRRQIAAAQGHGHHLTGGERLARLTACSVSAGILDGNGAPARTLLSSVVACALYVSASGNRPRIRRLIASKV